MAQEGRVTQTRDESEHNETPRLTSAGGESDRLRAVLDSDFGVPPGRGEPRPLRRPGVGRPGPLLALEPLAAHPRRGLLQPIGVAHEKAKGAKPPRLDTHFFSRPAPRLDTHFRPGPPTAGPKPGPTPVPPGPPGLVVYSRAAVYQAKRSPDRDAGQDVICTGQCGREDIDSQ